MSFGRYIADTRFSDRVVGCEPNDDRFRRINHALCSALDVLKLQIVLRTMVDNEIITEQQASVYADQAGCLLALLRTENNRGHGV